METFQIKHIQVNKNLWQLSDVTHSSLCVNLSELRAMHGWHCSSDIPYMNGIGLG